jgi:hypothetical protein
MELVWEKFNGLVYFSVDNEILAFSYGKPVLTKHPVQVGVSSVAA